MAPDFPENITSTKNKSIDDSDQILNLRRQRGFSKSSTPNHPSINANLNKVDVMKNTKKRSLEESSDYEKREVPKLDLTLRLTPPGGLHSSSSPDPSSSSSHPPPPSSSSSSSGDQVPCIIQRQVSLVLVGCRSCLMFLMVPQNHPICINCKRNTNLVDSWGNQIHLKKPRTNS